MSRDRKKKRNQQSSNLEPIQSEIITHNNPAPHTKKSVRIIPKNERQEEYLEQLMDPQKMIVIATGPAGTGKSVLAMLAGIKALTEKKVNKLILCRPSVGVSDENLGFLPGTIEDKMEPWVIPLMDVLTEYYSAKEIGSMIDSKVIEFLPLMYMRGRNIKNSFVILDEGQNTTIEQCKALFTRLCENSKLVVTGDNDQSDKRTGENGLLFFKKALVKFGNSKYISTVEFTIEDVARHPVVIDVLDIFNHSGG